MHWQLAEICSLLAPYEQLALCVEAPHIGSAAVIVGNGASPESFCGNQGKNCGRKSVELIHVIRGGQSNEANSPN